ncbi:MAG: hypothetical protein QG656_2568 [Candidatus Hydrogenedentes bacterium]|nr:hypothetical protein [Candidatus Hydrogenedentota bacterium]
MNKHTLSRRTFLMGAAAVGLAAGRARASVSPNEKLNIAAIGVGGRGHDNIRELADQNIVALCDVDWRRASKSFEEFPNAEQFKDYRVMLEKRKDIDAVIVATPDHTHAPASMLAMSLGKHVYCEKPLTHSMVEAWRMRDKAREMKVATQMGNGGQASDSVRDLCELVWAGAIGPVREVHVWTDRPLGWWPQGLNRPEDTPSVPEKLDWDLWLGVAPERPYNPAYLPFKWRGWYDFGTGALGDIGCHAFHSIFKALKLAYPTSVESCSTQVFQETYPGGKIVRKETYPVGSIVRYEFPAREDMPPLKFVWYDGGLKPARPEEIETPLDDNGCLYIGDTGKMLGTRILPESKRREYTPPEKTLPRSPGHYVEWINACKGGEPAGSNFDMASMVTETVLLGNIALRAQKKLVWDHESGKITNEPEANEYLQRPYRAGWEF